jgi:hypothetical protein
LQPQPPPQQPPAPEPDIGDDPPGDLAPFAGAAKTDNWIVFFALSHFGQVTFVWLFITMRS